MPYKDDGSDVPAHVKGKKKRRQWSHVWNSVYQQTGSESRAFASANSVTEKIEAGGPLFKFGTAATGFTHARFGPFECGHCLAFDSIGDTLICTNPEVGDDPEVEKDAYGNPLIEFASCCNDYFPVDLEKLPMLQTIKAAGRSLDEVQIFCPLVKVDAAKREVWGVVTAEEPDKDNEICDYETTAPYYKAVVEEMSKATDGKNIFPLRAMHGLTAAGKGISIEFRKDAKEVFMGFKVVDDAEWKKVEENVYTGFSQGGRYIKKWKDGDYVRYTAKPGEVSLVDMPCLTRAHFDYVKADGSVEVRKFAAGTIPTRPTTVPEGVDTSNAGAGSTTNKNAEGCTCSCAECKGDNCPSCSATSKCPCGKVVQTKFLVSQNGKEYLPYTDGEGNLSRALMAKAWNSLHGFRGKTYDGPNKATAIRRLKQVYAKEGLETPSEKAARIDELLKTSLEDTIQSRAYGMLNKGMYTVSRFAQITEDIKYLWLSLEYEREQEGDESPVTDDVKEAYTNLLEHLLAYTEEQVEEEKERAVLR